MELAAVGDLHIDEVLVDYDGPRVFVCTDDDGDLRLGLSVVDDGQQAQYCLVPVSAEDLARLRTGEISLRAPFEHARQATMVIVTHTGTRAEDLPGPLEHLPERDIRLTDLVEADEAAGQAQVTPAAAVAIGGVGDLVSRVLEVIGSLGRQRTTLRFAATREVHMEQRNAALRALGLGSTLQVAVGATPGSPLVTLVVNVERVDEVRSELQVQVAIGSGAGREVVRRTPLREAGSGRMTAELADVDIEGVTRIEIVAAAAERR